MAQASAEDHMACPFCDRSDLKGRRGLNVHITRMHPEEKQASATISKPRWLPAANDSEDQMTCPFCDRSDLKGRRGLNGHITRMHPEEKHLKSPSSQRVLEWVNGEQGPALEHVSRDEKSGLKGRSASPRSWSTDSGISSLHSSVRSKGREQHPQRSAQQRYTCPLGPHECSTAAQLNRHLMNKHDEALADVCDQAKQVGLRQEEVAGQADILNRVIDDLLYTLGSDWERLPVGSYYDKTKIHNPDEFDIMFCQRRIRCKYYVKDGHYCKLEVLDKNSVDRKLLTEGKWLCPKAFMDYFRHLVQKAKRDASPQQERYSMRHVKIKTDPTSPAVEVSIERTTYNDGSRPAVKTRPTVDLVPAIELDGWPVPDAKKCFKWIHFSDVIARATDGFHAVAKIHPNEYTKPAGQCTLWRLSFSRAEKELLLHADGTHSDRKTCRKDILRLLKSNLHELNSNFPKSEKLTTFSSFHLKSLMLQLFNRHTGHGYWDEEKKGLRYIQALMVWQQCLEDGHMEHPFLPGDNILRDVNTREGRKDRKRLLAHIQLLFDRLARV